MKIRLAKKIMGVHCANKKKGFRPYWWYRLLAFAVNDMFGECYKDHRIKKAISLTRKKK